MTTRIGAVLEKKAGSVNEAQKGTKANFNDDNKARFADAKAIINRRMKMKFKLANHEEQVGFRDMLSSFENKYSISWNEYAKSKKIDIDKLTDYVY